MNKGVAFLMYHELRLPGNQLCQNGAGYARYVVAEEEFREHLEVVQANGWRGWNVTEALAALPNLPIDSQPGVCFTFDDGCASDLRVAAPLLRSAGLNATFYVTVDHLGRRGYLTEAGLRELSDLGFEIGSHSMTHRHLNDLGGVELEREIAGSKGRLEEIIARRVSHFSCPGGRMNTLVAEMAARAGYESVATSRIGMNNDESDRFALKRFAIRRGTTTRSFERLCCGKGQLLKKSEDSILSTGKRLLGNQRYDRLRSSILSLAHRTESSTDR
jgi:peptidoglycan/xylan/chitin deacetylase (PgdA/CDA1 family)